MAAVENALYAPAEARTRGKASWWGRVGATILDGIIMSVPLFLGGAASAAGIDILAGLLILVYFLGLLFYAPILLYANDGRTWGKQAADIRVERLDGQAPGFGRAFLRELLKAVLGFTVVLWIIDVLWPLWQPEGRALHDLAAGTRVVRTDGGAPPPPGYYDADEERPPAA
jgi:uncharacterized RDD family membrane protein YckC